MSKTIIVCGHGPGISSAVAKKFGAEGYSVALVARSAERLEAAAADLAKAGVTAKAFATDLSDGDAVRAMVRAAREALGPIAVVHWNAYGSKAGDLTTAPIDELKWVLDVSVNGMIAALQESLEDLKASKGALLVTGGGLAYYNPQVETMAVDWGAMGLAIGKAAQHKAVGVLSHRLKKEGVYVGEVVVLGLVKGTTFDTGNATLDPADIADKFWSMNQTRDVTSVNFPS